MRVRLLAADDLTPGDIADWAELNERSAEPSPYADPRWMLPAARADGVGRDLRIAYLDDGAEPLVVLPVAPTRERVVDRVPVTVRAVSTDGSFFRRWGVRWYPIVAPEADVDTMVALLLGFRQAGISIVHVAPLFVDSPVWEALNAAAASSGMPTIAGSIARAPWAPPRSDLTSPLGPEGLVPTFTLAHWSDSSNKRLARYARALERDLAGPLTLTIEPHADAEFLHLQAAGWKGDVKAGGHAVLSTGMAEWFGEVADGFRGRGAWMMFRLGSAETTVHMYCCAALSSGVFGLHDAYDERFAHVHPGTLGRVAVQNAVVGSGRYFDPCLSAEYTEAGHQFAVSRNLSSLRIATGASAARVARTARAAGLSAWH